MLVLHVMIQEKRQGEIICKIPGIMTTAPNIAVEVWKVSSYNIFTFSNGKTLNNNTVAEQICELNYQQQKLLAKGIVFTSYVYNVLWKQICNF